MTDITLVGRVEMLEETVQSLKQLPDRLSALEVRLGDVESQIVQLRGEMRDGFSAVHQELATKASKDDLTGFAAKDDLQRFATKDDLQRFATKDDLQRFATKDDLQRFATRDDLQRFATKDDLQRFATKDDLVETKGELRQEMAEMKAELREDMASLGRDLAGRILDSEERTGRQMRVLHEDLVARITTISDGRSGIGG